MSQPFIVALMTDLLAPRPDHVVLEIGTGSGYQAAVLSPLVEHVCSIEIIPELGESAAAILERLGYDNVETRIGDGYYGWEDCGPFDGIVVTAAASHVPPPLVRQLKPGGRMVIPVGGAFVTQQLTLVEKEAGGRVHTRQILPVAFVPLVREAAVTIYLAIAVLSAATLAYEVLLLRLFAIAQWHHFAYMAISIALLGFGASGTFLFLAQRWLKPRFICAFAANAAAFGITALTGFVLAQRLPFNALQVVWEPRQLLYLLVLYPLLALPFFAAANCIGLAFARFGDKIGRVYAFNLVGSGVGALGLVGLLHLLYPESALRLVAGLGLGAAALALLSDRRYRVWAAGLGAAALIVPITAPASWTALRLSPYKSLSMALQVPGTELLGETSSPLGLLTVVRSPLVPFRHAPGLSLNNVIEPSPQLGVFTDGNGMTAITAFDGDLQPLTYLGFTTAALPYHLLEKPRTLILGAGGGADVLQALFHKAAAVDAVELDLRMIRLVSRDPPCICGRRLCAPRRSGPCSRSARLRRGQSEQLGPDPDSPARFVCGSGGRRAWSQRELCLYGRGLAGVSPPPRDPVAISPSPAG